MQRVLVHLIDAAHLRDGEVEDAAALGDGSIEVSRLVNDDLYLLSLLEILSDLLAAHFTVVQVFDEPVVV